MRRCAVLTWAAMGAVLALGFFAGCPGANDNFDDIEYHDAEALGGSQEHLSRAVRMIESEKDGETITTEALISHVMTQLGQWVHNHPPVEEWSSDPLINSLPKQYQPGEKYLKSMGFDRSDFFVLREAIWARNISRWQVAQKDAQRDQLLAEVERLENEIDRLKRGGADPGESARLDESQDELKAKQAKLTPDWLASVSAKNDPQYVDQLTTALHLFDWTIRNVRLEPTNWNAKLPDSGQGEDAGDGIPPAPPGAARPLWRALLLGRGDAATRGRVFALLARQQGIDVVFLGLKQASNEPPRMWAAGAMIGDDLYLFDPELGLVLRNSDGGPATLREVVETPSVLRQFDVGDFTYHIQEADLDRLIGLIDAPPAHLTQRMMLVEQSLPADQRLRLATSPSTLARTLRKLRLQDVVIWTSPYQQHKYEELLKDNPNRPDMDDLLPHLQPLMLLMVGRLQHFAGELDGGQGQGFGAKYCYMACRPSDARIEEPWAVAEMRAPLIEALPSALLQLQQHKDNLRRLLPDAQQEYPEMLRQELERLPPDKLREVVISLPLELRSHFMNEIPPKFRWRFAVMLSLTEMPPGETREAFLAKIRSLARQAKAEATFWLGMLAIEQRQPGAAIDYLGARTMEAEPDGPWSEAARYNLARIYENAGQTSRAIELYEGSQSPQRHGNLARAKRLKEKAAN